MRRLRLAIAKYLSITLLCTISVQASASDAVTYAYDALGRLVSATAEGRGAIYRYDAAGNLTAITANNSPLAITALQPGSGIAGTAVTITGTGFSALASDNAVKFNGVSASVQSASATQIVALVPAGAASGNVSVTTAAGTADSPMTFHIDSGRPPTISGVTPGVAAPGSAVIISGTSFDTTAKIYFGSTYSPYRTVSSTSLAVDVPTRAESGKIKVVTVNGMARSSEDFLVAPSGISAADITVTGRLGFGQPQTVNLGVAGKKAMLLFDGVAGQKVSLHIGPSTISSAVASILAPGNAILGTSSFKTSGGFIDALTLPVSGTYAVLINPASTSVGNPVITLYTFTDATIGLVPGGAAAQITTTVPGQNALLAFSGSAGQRISTLLNGVSFTGSSYLYASLRKPDGSVLLNDIYVSTGGTFIDTQTLPVSGNYTLLLNPPGAALAKATVQLYDVPADLSATASVGGAPVPITTTVPGQNAAIMFNGVAGQRISSLLNGVSFTGGSYLYASLRKPDGSVMQDNGYVSTSGAFLDTQILPVSGNYTLLLNPPGAALAKATVQLYEVPADLSVTASVGGVPVPITTMVPGQNAAIVFKGMAGQRISSLLNGVSFTGGSYLYASLRKPDGSVMVDSIYVSSSGAFLDTQTLPVSGNYTLLLNPPGAALAKATVQLYDVPADFSATASVGGAPVSITTMAPGQNATIVYNGVAGQRISTLLNGVSFTGGSYLYASLSKPDGGVMLNSVIVTSGGAFLDTQILPVSGNYTLLLNPQGTALAKATVQLFEVPADLSVTASVGDAPVPIATTVPGQNAAIVFDGVAGQRISALLNGVSFTGGSYLYASLRKPDGSVMVDNVHVWTSGAFLDTQILPVSGNYTLLLNPPGAALVKATVQLYDVPADLSVTASAGGVPVPITTMVPGQNAAIVFNGVAGQRISSLLNGVSFTGGSYLYASLRKPDGGVMLDNVYVSTSGAFLDTQILPTDGTYTLRLDPGNAAMVQAQVQLFNVPAPASLATTIGSTATAITTTVPGQNASLTFDANQGQSVIVAATGNTMGCVDLTLRKPDGSKLTSKLTCGSSVTITPPVLPASGNYSIDINPNGANVGVINIRITSP